MQPQNKVSWQMQDGLMWPQAYLMTIVEAFINPWEYFEKLEPSDDYIEPITFSLLNTMILAWPLARNPLEQTSWVMLSLIVLWVVLGIGGLSWFVCGAASLVGKRFKFAEIFYVFAFSTPVFVLALIPMVGYWLAAMGIFIYSGLGFFVKQRRDLRVIAMGLVLTPVLVLIPFAGVKSWLGSITSDSQLKPQQLAENILAVTSVAAEQYAIKNQGRYPTESSVFVSEHYLKEDYCGQEYAGYLILCDLRNYGYYIQAKPQGFRGRGLPHYVVTTGGSLRMVR